MAEVASPYGLRVIKLLGDLPFSGGMHTFPLGNTGPAFPLFFGDPVAILNGALVQAITPAVSAGAPTAANPVGVMMGASWQDPVRGFVNAQYLPASLTNVKDIQIKVCDYPWLIMAVQANGSVTGPPSGASRIGMRANLIPGAGGSIITGNSSWQVDAASVAAGAGSVLIYDYVVSAAPAPGAGSKPGDPYTDLLVLWPIGVHRWTVGQGA